MFGSETDGGDEVQTDVAKLLNIKNCHMVAKQRNDWRKKTGEATARKPSEEP
jgi:hypothetical protein